YAWTAFGTFTAPRTPSGPVAAPVRRTNVDAIRPGEGDGRHKGSEGESRWGSTGRDGRGKSSGPWPRLDALSAYAGPNQASRSDTMNRWRPSPRTPPLAP